MERATSANCKRVKLAYFLRVPLFAEGIQRHVREEFRGLIMVLGTRFVCKGSLADFEEFP